MEWKGGLKMRKTKYGPEFMAKVALAALQKDKTMSEVSSQYEVHSTQITRWRQRALEGLVEIFRGKPTQRDEEKEKLVEELYRQIGRLKVENEWLKKKSAILEY
jgi:putative transposase